MHEEERNWNDGGAIGENEKELGTVYTRVCFEVGEKEGGWRGK